MSQPTEDANHRPGAWYEDSDMDLAGEAGSADTDAVIGMIDGFNAGSPGREAGASSAINPNRNLSDVIHKIRDDGPPPGQAGPGEIPERAPAGIDGGAQPRPAYAEVSAVPPPARRRLTPWILLVLLALIITLPAYLVLTGRSVAEMPGYQLLGDAFDRAGTLLSGMREPNQATEIRYLPGRDPLTGQQIQELQAAQAEIVRRLDELSAELAAITADDAGRRDIADTGPAPAADRDTDEAPAATREAAAPPAESVTAAPATAGETAPPESAVVPPEPVQSEGTWILNLASSTSEEAILALQKKFRSTGHAVELQTATVSGQTRYRLRIPGFATRQLAREYADRHGRELRIKDPWISQE